MNRILAALAATIAAVCIGAASTARADDDPYGVDTTVCPLWIAGFPPSQIVQDLHSGPLHLPLVTANQQTWTAIFDRCQP